MNEVFLIGRIVSDIDFKFIINDKQKAVAKFKIETIDETILEVEAFDENADYVFSHTLGTIFINGRLKEKMKIVAEEIIELH